MENTYRKSGVIGLTLLFLLTASAALKAQQVAKITPKSSIGYYEYVPPDYNSNTNNYPVVYFLHGLGERGNGTTDLPKVASNGPPKYVKNGYQFPFILISPQLTGTLTDWPPWYIDEVIEHTKTYLRIDQSRIYLTGLSLGGGGAWWYVRDPILAKKIAALAVVCGSRNETAKACIIADNNIPVWAFHGDKDGTIPFARTVNMINAINACAPPPNPLAIMTIYPGVNHNAWDNAYRTDHLLHNPNIYEWMMQFKNGGVSVNAGPDVILNLPLNSTNITALASTETGAITSYNWVKTSGPAVGTIANGSTSTVSLSNLAEGIYTFQVTVTNSGGETATDEVKVTVIQVNQAPVANAGPDKTITLPTNSLNLNGSGSDVDGSIASYSWTKVSGPTATLTGANTATLQLSALLQGTYVFSLTVIDDKGASNSDDVTVVVNPAAVNQAPLANAGPDQTVNLPTSSINLPGSGSDPDGTVTGYLWEKLSGPTVTITNATTATASLSSLLAGTYTFRLTVTDNQGATSTDTVVITVVAANQSPVANAGSDQTITLPTNTTVINGSGNDPDGSISGYSWTQVSGPNSATLSNATTPSLTTSGLIAGAYTFRLTVTDNKSATAFDDVVVTVNAAPVNQPPMANAGPDKGITLPTNSIVLNGSGTDSDGSIASYNWVLISGPTATLVNANTANLTATNLLAGSYDFRLTVTDNNGATAFDDVIVSVQPAAVNMVPIANAGSDKVLTLPVNSVTLNGLGTDSDGTISSYLWIKLTGPAATLTGDNTANLQLSNLVEGTYTFQLTVTDDQGATGSDEVTVLVTSVNTPPTANAGSDITITLPTSSTNITGSGSDADGTITAYQWTQVGGPNSATLTNTNTTTVLASGLIAGTYTFRLTVTDDDSATGTDDVKVTVNAANVSPVAQAGADQSITLPTNTANFTGNGTDADGTIASYLWVQVSGPPATLANENTKTLTVTVALDGSYSFRLTVTDNKGATDFDDVNLTVNPAAINQPPVANAGSNVTITLPLNSVNLTGTGSDPDGSIASYSWTKISGPSATLTNANNATVSVSDLLEGNYVFRLTVTDNGGLQATSNVSVTVLPAVVNQPPTANAGPDQSITLPVNSITLFGNGSDADGTVLTYSWTKLTGPAATLANETTPSLSLSGLVQGTYTFRLMVTDEDGATASDDVTLTVNAVATNQLPTANAGPDKTLTLPTNITNLSGSGSDPDGSIAGYLWVKVSGPTVTLGTTTQPVLSISNLVEGIYTFRLQVTDNQGAKATDDVQVTVLAATVNQPPVVNAGPDRSIFLPTNSLNLNGSASDVDGSITTLSWTQVAGAAATLANTNTVTLSVSNLVEGVYIFRLTATDDTGASTFDEATVTVNAATVNQPPTANAGPDVTVKLPTNSTTLSGVGNDADGTISTYAWTKVGGPTVTLTGQATATLNLTNLVEGSYRFKLTVTDDLGATASDLVDVTVLPAAINAPPVANAGSNVSIVLPANTASFTGSASDSDGTVVETIWTQISGPSSATMTGQTTLNLSVSNLIAGVYTFRLTVKDDGDLTDFDDATVTVFELPTVTPAPTVDAGSDVVLQLPDNSTTITANANSPNGLIVSYKWTQVLGELVTIEPDSTAILSLENLIPGQYAFRVTVVDASAQEAFDEVDVMVLEEEPIIKPLNMFSPNNDGKYDTWAIRNTQLMTGCQLAVYNRQGLKVFESVGYASEWDGTFNGKPLPQGAYFYVIRCSGQKDISGSVTIVR